MVDSNPNGTGESVTIYSGSTGFVIFNYPGWNGALSPWMSAAGDIDGDGRADFLIGDQDKSTVRVYSGRDGGEIDRFTPGFPRFGLNLRSVGDLDGDGSPDIGSVYANATHTADGVCIVSGADGSTLFSHNFSTPWSFDTAGDLDADGVPEVWIGDFGDNGYTGLVTAYSIATGQPVLTLYGENAGDNFGVEIVRAGDVDGDGLDDIAIAATGFNASAGRVYLFSGATGASLGSIDGVGPNNYLGSWMARGADLDGDGHSDIIVGDSIQGLVLAYSGSSLGLLSSVASNPNDDSTFGLYVSNGGDVDGDGYADFFVAASAKNGTILLASRVYAYSLSRHPRAFSTSPIRARYTGGANLTVSGEYFAAAEAPVVLFDGVPATGVSVIDDATLSCTVPAGLPGPATLTLSNSLGTGVLDGAFTYTPAVVWDGSATPGGNVAVHVLCDQFDGMLIIAGTDPVSVPTPPYEGTLGIAPFFVFLVLPPGSWPFDHFDLSGTVPNDPALIGATILVQALDGPKFTPPKDATWTNVAEITIQ